MAPECPHFSFSRDDESLRIDFVVDAKLPENVISFTADLDNMPNLYIQES